MDLILATADGREERTVWDTIDIEVGTEADNSFEMSIPSYQWDGSLAFGKRLYIPGTEYGGIIRDIVGNTNLGTVKVRGYTWRGQLAHKIIQPASGQDYYTVSGELNAVIATVLNNTLGDMYQVSSEDTGVSVSNYQFNRYVDMNKGLSAMLASKGYRLDLSYVQTDTSGYVELSAQPADTYADDIEISQDTMLTFTSEDNRMGTNHLICLGKGELAERTVIHLYADVNGNISQTRTITGLDEIVDVFDDSSAEYDDLLKNGTERFLELISKKTFQANFQSTDIELRIGDIITGRDYITGNVATQPIVRKIIKRENGTYVISYKIQGEQ